MKDIPCKYKDHSVDYDMIHIFTSGTIVEKIYTQLWILWYDYSIHSKDYRTKHIKSATHDHGGQTYVTILKLYGNDIKTGTHTISITGHTLYICTEQIGWDEFITASR